MKRLNSTLLGLFVPFFIWISLMFISTSVQSQPAPHPVLDANKQSTIQTGIDGTTTIPLTSLYIKVESDGGDVTVTADPRIANGEVDGDLLILQGTSDTDKLIFENGNGMAMSTSVTLGDRDKLAVRWDADNVEWNMEYSDMK